MEAVVPLKFAQTWSFIVPSFWHKLTEIKLDQDKLDQPEHPIWGYYEPPPANIKTSIVTVDSTSFNEAFDRPKNHLPFYGKLINKNTVEQFKQCDKTALINREGRDLLALLNSGTILEMPGQLNRFLCLTYANLKTYQFYYWFAFPVPYNLSLGLIGSGPIPISAAGYSQDQIQNLYQEFVDNLDPNQRSYFLVDKMNLRIEIHSKVLPQLTLDNFEDFLFAFVDFFPTYRVQLKNYILFILHHCPFLSGKRVKFLQFRALSKAIDQSEIFTLQLPVIVDNIQQDLCEQWVGWEKNDQQELGPRLANMRNHMDPKILIEESADLNLKLMKWRMLPNFDLDRVKSTKFLLLGAGTLGCSVARTLLGWGAKTISFVDNSTVSFANPIRQILYTFEDAMEAKKKCQTAAESLQRILPSVISVGHHLSIPMPGYPVGESSVGRVQEQVGTLQDLIRDHDVIFLLTDSRESRWLPTLFGYFYGRIVITCALGFDSYLVMRHGCRNTANYGCYFCSDVTAPGNSSKDQSLDQQCTVSRAGVSFIAGALAAEMAIALIQHPKGINAPTSLDPEGILGPIPHTIRGFLSDFNQIKPFVQRYEKCVGCSNAILEEFEKEGFQFLLKVFNEPKYLEQVTGLDQLAVLNMEEILELSDEESV